MKKKLKEEYINLRNKQQALLNSALREANKTIKLQLMKDAVSKYTERLGELGIALRAVGIDPAAL